MRYILDEQKVIIFPSLLKYIDSGREGKVYKYKNKALKIYHFPAFENSMNEETAAILKELNTKRILLPQSILYDIDYEIKGYTTEFIPKKENVYKITKEQLIIELKELQKEINYLTTNKILINDWNYCENFIYDGMFRFIDPGLYEYDKSMSNNEIKKFNYSVLRDFLFYELLKYGLMNEKTNFMKLIGKKYDKSRKKDNVSHFFENEMNDNETLQQYIKRIVKN